MSKPALGRGLGSLLEPPPSSTREGGPHGVQLLLRGNDGEELVPPLEVASDADDQGIFPRWALASAVVADLILLAVASWVALFAAGNGRLVVAALLTATGAGILSVAVWLRGQPAVLELELLNPIAEEKPRLRVRFMDETPNPPR